LHRSIRIRQIFRRAVAFRRIPDVDECMRIALEKFRLRFGSTHIHTPIHHGGIQTDQRDRKPVGERHGNLGFAHRRGADQGDDPPPVFTRHRY
jgi:hypothetical protein